MKKIILFAALSFFLSSEIFAECAAEPLIESTGNVLKELRINNKSDLPAEYSVTLTAAAFNASWEKRGAEAGVLTIFIDGNYNQDVILFAGDEMFDYRLLIGDVTPGEHKISLVRNEKRSATGAGRIKIKSAAAIPLEKPGGASRIENRSAADYLARINSPLIYLRPETIDKFSDIPLLTYYEIFDESNSVSRIRYTTVFTNEDGGTLSTALMARWGRLTDIEWVYEMRIRHSGEILSEIYQGTNHEIKEFKGKRFASHPILFDSTVNNNFSDSGCSDLRVSPLLVRTDLSNGSRETVMDRFAWTYRIMAQEAMREGRVNSAKLDANTIADPRDYLYMEIMTEPENAAVSVEIENDRQISASDYGEPRLRVERPGYIRIAVRKPVGLKKTFPEKVNLVCSEVSKGKKGFCRNLKLEKIVWLDRRYAPREKKLALAAQNVEAGQKAIFRIE